MTRFASSARLLPRPRRCRVSAVTSCVVVAWGFVPGCGAASTAADPAAKTELPLKGTLGSGVYMSFGLTATVPEMKAVIAVRNRVDVFACSVLAEGVTEARWPTHVDGDASHRSRAALSRSDGDCALVWLSSLMPLDSRRVAGGVRRP